MNRKLLILSLSSLLSLVVVAQNRENGDPQLSEVYTPVPRVVTPGASSSDAPADAIVLFDGKHTSAWAGNDGKAIKWKNEKGILTVARGAGEIHTTQEFGDCQLHIEWRSPAEVKGEGQGRGNSGIFLMSRYELQVLDSYNNKTYSNGQAGSIYKQLPPLVNACRPPGEWQTYDVIFTAPRFYADGSVQSQARITVLHNGVLVQNNATIWGATQYIGISNYEKHADKMPLILQDHGDAVSYRNIWIRPL
ncbi:MAG: DUF1080 domain-containing protein [Candidatus Pseudobacter hemicellulosilyticus]|uniref:DUF1080 domain-containing protein n=1 Tax=Candidatus Pseudobacter hemicellulosilyticus TaxID=3121375 RepID=A0AAJ5WVC6_9BACT|nr:MAG: DUF1080 domain-containing protein [Pseudobacter sp.]